MKPEDIDAVLERANRLLEAGRPAETLRCLNEVEGELVDADDRIEWGALRAYALADTGQAEEALLMLDPLIEEYPESARLFGALGVVLSGTNDLEQAREALETAVSLDPEDESLLANLALVYERLRDYATAIRLYDRALELGADLDWALQRKAAALSESGDTAAAKSTLKRYLSLAPEDAEQWIALAILYSDDDEYDEAFACYRWAEEIQPDSASLRLNWGVSAVRAGQIPLAERQLDRLREVDGESSRALLLAAFIHEEKGNLRAAQRCYAKAVRGTNESGFSEASYVFEMAMDFFARRKMRLQGEHLLHRAYHANACTVELCEAYRELTGRYLRHGYWFSLVVEANHRDGLCEIHEPGATRGAPVTRFQRSYQVVARDRDDAVSLALDFARRMGETGLVVCEFAREEPLENTYSGIYEVERESLVLHPQ
ncbi:MAG: tetratricopeptide repeat protein [Phycisphaerae bacterium]|jgi:tetratricopeptide (TPR) repeat protein